MPRTVSALVLAALLLPGLAVAREPVPRGGAAPAVMAARQGRVRAMVRRVRHGVARPLKAAGRKLVKVKGQIKALRKQADKLRLERIRLRPLSTSTLLAGSTTTMLNLTRAAGPIAGPITGIGSIGLGYASVRALIKAENTRRRAEALHGVAWSMQGLTSLGFALKGKFSWLGPTSKALGVAGGALQAGVGAWRLGLGIKERQKERIVLGALDMGGGTSWAASACAIGGPWSLAGFVALTSARMAYEHRDFLRVAGSKLKEKASHRVRRTRRKVRVKVGRATGRLRQFMPRGTLSRTPRRVPAG